MGLICGNLIPRHIVFVLVWRLQELLKIRKITCNIELLQSKAIFTLCRDTG